MKRKTFKRRSFVQKLTFLSSLFGLGSLSVKAGQTRLQKHGSFVHVVFFWLKNPDKKKDRRQFENNLNTFIKGIDYIRFKHVGTPAGTDRSVVDNSYTYCLIVSFDSKKDHDAYQEDGLHKKFIEDTAALWEKVQVYDSLLI